MATYWLRWMLKSDVMDVMRLEALKPQPLLNPEKLSQTLRSSSPCCIGLVVEDVYDQVCGYIVYELAAKKLDVLYYGVDFVDDGCIVMRLLLQKLIGKLSNQRRTMLQINVHESDVGMQVFLRDYGLLCVGIRDTFYIFEHHFDLRTKVVLRGGMERLLLVD